MSLCPSCEQAPPPEHVAGGRVPTRSSARNAPPAKSVQPVELCLPPSGVSDPTVGAKLLDVRGHSGNDRVDHLVAGVNLIGTTEDLDPAYLFGDWRPSLPRLSQRKSA